MINNIFEINCITIKVEDWSNKKNKILKLLENYPEYKYDIFHTNRHKSRTDFGRRFSMILKNDLKKISEETKLHFKMKECWSVTYKKNEYHNPHNHGSKGFSAILYLDYNPKIHSSTYYVCPFNNPLEDKSLQCESNAVEGDLVCTPSFLMHFTHPNTSNKPKRIIAFDFELFE